MSVKQLHLRGMSILCCLFVLLGIYLIFRPRATVKIDSYSVTRNTSIVLDDEKRSLAAGSWQAIPVNIPYKGLLEIDFRVVRGNPIDVVLIDGNQLNLLTNKGWSNETRNPTFTASGTKTYQETAEIAEGSYYLVYRDASLGVLSTDETNITVKITLSSF